ncbi:hypothetical protein ED208_04350 [Stagnimonas aquatica]|uniref:Lipid A biosynthesis acyltransferase n=1 Tax=Stagnimonas aquatica TaxID=2689987 RepID=A0A3N0VMG4_9GAMM|nr:lysophospholipid acyltransferase family protein [Stagnimonas aquatica]ROH93760.1 hypothetical protein ED208_04350 [Stagnimonas aquatica]
MSDCKKAAVRCLLRGLGSLPLPLIHVLAALSSLLLLVLPNRLQQVSGQQLRYCLPELGWARRRSLVVASLGHSMMAALEAPAIWFGPERRLRRWLRAPEAAAQLASLRAQGRGVILLCPHWGAWELAGLFCAAQGPMTSLYKPQKGLMEALILEGRSRLGAQLVPTSPAGVKQLLSALKRGGMVGILPDHDPPEGSGVYAPLFGHPAHTMELVSKLAARTGAPVWFCLAERRPLRGFRIGLQAAPVAVADPQQGPAALNAGVEAVIRAAPGQYWWSYPRYRRRPPGSPDPYA